MIIFEYFYGTNIHVNQRYIINRTIDNFFSDISVRYKGGKICIEKSSICEKYSSSYMILFYVVRLGNNSQLKYLFNKQCIFSPIYYEK